MPNGLLALKVSASGGFTGPGRNMRDHGEQTIPIWNLGGPERRARDMRPTGLRYSGPPLEGPEMKSTAAATNEMVRPSQLVVAGDSAGEAPSGTIQGGGRVAGASSQLADVAGWRCRRRSDGARRRKVVVPPGPRRQWTGSQLSSPLIAAPPEGNDDARSPSIRCGCTPAPVSRVSRRRCGCCVYSAARRGMRARALPRRGCSQDMD